MPQALWTHCGFVYILSKIVFMFLHLPLSASLLLNSRVLTDEANNCLRFVLLWWNWNYAQFPSPCMHEERVMHLIFKSSLQEQHRPLSEGYFIVCWSNECSGYFKGGKFSSADERHVNLTILYALITNADIPWFFITVFARNLWSRKCRYKEFGCIWEDFFFILSSRCGKLSNISQFFVHYLQYLSFGIDFQKYFLLLKSYKTIFWFLQSNHKIFWQGLIYVWYNFFNGVFFASNNLCFLAIFVKKWLLNNSIEVSDFMMTWIRRKWFCFGCYIIICTALCLNSQIHILKLDFCVFLNYSLEWI